MSVNTLIAASAIFETLFNKRTIGQRDETTSSILIDTFKSDYPFDATLESFQSSFKSTSYLQAKFKD